MRIKQKTKKQEIKPAQNEKMRSNKNKLRNMRLKQ